MIQVLISVTDATEARAALAGGAGIIDVKNPAEGALGAAPVGALREVCAVLPPGRPGSAALGESTDQPGALALAAYGAAALGVSYVKVGLRMADPAAAVALMRAVQVGARAANPACLLIAVGYADAARIGALDWAVLPEIAAAAGIGGCMIDTAIKDGRGLFDYCAAPALAHWLAGCRAAGLRCALAGALCMADLPALRALRPDIAGFRSAVCRGDRVSGRVDVGLVAAVCAGLSGSLEENHPAGVKREPFAAKKKGAPCL